MKTPSARDLLRKARAQNPHRQHRQPARAAQLPASLSAIQRDKHARIDPHGNVFCDLCETQIKSNNLRAWATHKTSHRHRSRLNSDIAQREKHDIEKPEEKSKRARLDPHTQASIVGYTSDSEPERRDSSPPVEPSPRTSDNDVADAEEDRVSLDDERTGLPDGFFDDPREQTAAVNGLGEIDAENLARFESEIAELVEEPVMSEKTDEDLTLSKKTDEDLTLSKKMDDDLALGKKPDEELDDETWDARKRRLVGMRDVIRQAVGEVDADEGGEMETESSDSASSDGEFEEFVDWRSGAI